MAASLLFASDHAAADYVASEIATWMPYLPRAADPTLRSEIRRIFDEYRSPRAVLDASTSKTQLEMIEEEQEEVPRLLQKCLEAAGMPAKAVHRGLAALRKRDQRKRDEWEQEKAELVAMLENLAEASPEDGPEPSVGDKAPDVTRPPVNNGHERSENGDTAGPGAAPPGCEARDPVGDGARSTGSGSGIADDPENRGGPAM
jgi:hypothetical protein